MRFLQGEYMLFFRQIVVVVIPIQSEEMFDSIRVTDNSILINFPNQRLQFCDGISCARRDPMYMMANDLPKSLIRSWDRDPFPL